MATSVPKALLSMLQVDLSTGGSGAAVVSQGTAEVPAPLAMLCHRQCKWKE